MPDLSDSDAQKALDGVGEGFSAHLKELLKRINQEGTPEDAFRALEVVSRNIKHPGPGVDAGYDRTLTEAEVEAKSSGYEPAKGLHANPADEEGNLLRKYVLLFGVVEESHIKIFCAK